MLSRRTDTALLRPRLSTLLNALVSELLHSSSSFIVNLVAGITEWSTFDNANLKWYSTGSQSEGLTWANHIQSSFAVSNVSAFLYWWGAADTPDNQALVYINNDTVVVSSRLWAMAQYSRFVHPGAIRVGATVSNYSSLLNVTAFANTDGSLAMQVINNGNTAQPVILQGVASRGASITTYLTDNSNDLTEGTISESSLGVIIGNVPARALMSFVVSG